MAAEPTPMPVRVRIKPMKRRHLNQVLEIEGQAYTSGWSRSIFLNELLYARDREYVVAKVGRTVVGYVGLMFTPDEGHVTTIAVHPDWRRQRIATRLMLHALDVTLRNGRTAMTLEVRVSNTAAQSMYEGFGFTSAGIRPGYYADNREDAVIMWVRDLGSDASQARIADIRSAIDEANGGR